MKKYISLISLLAILAPIVSFAQQHVFSISFKDQKSEKAIPFVSVLGENGSQLGTADTNGMVRLTLGAGQYPPFLIMASGYTMDTIHSMTDQTFYLSPLSVILNQAVVNSSKVERVFQSSRDYVIDYEFVGDNILVASYTGTRGKGAKLLLLTAQGDTLAVRRINETPKSLYKNCQGAVYCVFEDKFCRLDIAPDEINLVKSYDIKYLDLVKECQQCIGDTEYFKLGDRYNNFHTVYGWQKIGDSVFHRFMNLDRNDTKRASDDELATAIGLYNTGQIAMAQHVLALRWMWDKSPLKGLDAPLYRYRDDSLLLFDFHKKEIYAFGQSADTFNKHDISFPYTDVLFFDILKDDKTGTFYLYRHHNQQTIQQLSIQKGIAITDPVKMEKPFVEEVKIHNGDIYYLWQAENGATRQLFVQHTFL